MTAIDGCELKARAAKHADERRLDAAGGPNCEDGEERRLEARLPWIGALGDPRLGPMLVFNERGNLVPLCTAVDLVRGCRSFWQRTQG